MDAETIEARALSGDLTFADLASYIAGQDTAAWLANVARVEDWPITSDASFIRAYWRCGGDPVAMTRRIMETVMAETVERLRDVPPLVVEGGPCRSEDLAWVVTGLRAERLVAQIEGHGQMRH